MLELNKIHLGDAYKLIKEIPDKSINAIVTDIPYKIGNGGKGRSKLAHRMTNLKNDLFEQDIYNTFDMAVLDDFVRIMKKINIFIWCSKLQIQELMNYFLAIPNVTFDILTWHKSNPSPLNNGRYLPDTEYCLSFREKGVVIKGGYDMQKKYWITSLNKQDKEHFEHLTIKPIHIIKQLIINTTNENEIIFDPFVGSGTTCVGAKDLNRQYLGIEINPKWHKVACDRLDCVTAGGQQSLFLM